jgi:transcriptional regulator with XRE-family HTH domain
MTITTPHDIAALRKRYRLTQRALADLLGTTESTVSRLERGELALDTRWTSHLGMLLIKLGQSSAADWPMTYQGK